MSAARKKGITFELVKDSYIGTLKKYIVFKGRARRQEFWIFFFVNLVLGLIPGIGQVVSLLTSIPSMAVGVRRLHDINRSGLWLLLGLVPLVGLIFMLVVVFFAVSRSGGLWLLSIPIFLFSTLAVVILLVWAAKEGTPGKNKYGPNPKARK